MADDNAQPIGRPPVTPVVVYPTGAYDAVRSSPRDGGCGIHAYPCRHPGEDLRAPKGTPVAAPHDGWIMVSKATEKAPFSGYGPAVVLIAHDDSTDPWMRRIFGALTGRRYALRYSLLAHLDPTSLTFRQDIPDGALGADYYDHVDDGTDVPTYALTTHAALPFYVKAGDVVGYVGDAGHVHWEVRKQPFGTHGDGATLDPFGWLAHYDDGTTAWGTTTLPVDTSRNPDGPRGGSRVVLVFAALAALAWWSSEKRTRRSSSGRPKTGRRSRR